MSTYAINTIYFVILITQTIAAPKSFSCISYAEEEGSLQDDSSLDDYVSTSAVADSEVSYRDSPAPPTSVISTHRRICQPDYTFCFALWRKTENGSRIEKQGCWKESTEHNATCNQRDCVSFAPTSKNNSLYYCCCSGDICNQNMSVIKPPIEEVANYEASNFEDRQYTENTIFGQTFIWCALITSCLTIIMLTAFYVSRSIRKKRVAEEAPLAPAGPGYSSNLRNVDNINLICILGSGKYGTVMKGLLHDKEVAVKIFPETHYQYYLNERNIYSLPLMDSPSLLTYFGYDEHHTLEGKVEYQLVLSLAANGCLQDWLIGNILSFETFCLMAKSITRGLSHLHTELRSGEKLKPCIAHRDLNSRNILVKSDCSCCIADFGFALKVFGSKYEYKGEIATAETKSINEVGTLRYMAPELLEGAVNLRDCETSLKQMDIYALGLILWELATRCKDFYSPAKMTPPYKGPYEMEVGAHPTFDQMQALVVRHKARPLFPAGWGGGAASKLVRDTCEDCWDHDAEARLTSLCAEERMQEVTGLPQFHSHTQGISPLLNAHNVIGDANISDVLAQSASNSRIEDTLNSTERAAINRPPNQQIYALGARSELVSKLNGVPSPTTEKNLLIHPQQQLQPYQGLNPCRERNLAPSILHAPQLMVQKSKKHSFRNSEDNSFSCLEDDVSVEDLLSNCSGQKFASMANTDAGHMGHGFPKQQNTEKKLRGWHSVRALIQKRLFRRDHNNDIFQQQCFGNEKSNLVENRYATIVAKPTESVAYPAANGSMKFLSSIPSIEVAKNEMAEASHKIALNVDAAQQQQQEQQNKRPKNLNLSYQQPEMDISSPYQEHCKNVISKKMSKCSENAVCRNDMCDIGVHPGANIPMHVVPRSLSASLIKNGVAPNRAFESKSINRHNKSRAAVSPASAIHDIKRQTSLEVFHEVFRGRGSTDKLRDPSQRVKTPGDVPPSVRRVRASKTLSLYDDRMMGSSAIVNNHIL